MIIHGKYAQAEVFTNVIDQAAISQVIGLCNHIVSENNTLAIMPDVHAGADCTIGTTLTITDKAIPNLVGQDIGCGVTVQPITLMQEIDWLGDVDIQIQKHIPAGIELRTTNHPYLKNIDLTKLKCFKAIHVEKVEKSLGTLGGGNHYIEINYDSKGRYYLVIHSGSRSLGMYIAKYYQELAYKTLNDHSKEMSVEIKAVVAKCISENRKHEIEAAVNEIKQKYADKKISKSTAYLEGQNLKDYLHDMNIGCTYAFWNRKAIIEDIIHAMDGRIVKAKDQENYHWFSTHHNYIDTEHMILRKGAVSAQKDEVLIIPISMKDGSIIAKGKGNKKWNYSAPHGAGRLMSRSKAKEEIDLELFEESMVGIHTSSVCESTIDESCFAYKNLEDIVNNIDDAVSIIDVIKPIYNFKAH